MKLDEIFDTYSRPVLWLSGGKDSLTLLHMCRPWRHKLIVIHNKVDDGWPGVTENLERCLDEWGFLRSVYTQPFYTLDKYIELFGYPVDVVPSICDGVVQPQSPFNNGHIKMANWWHCTLIRQIQPLVAATASVKADAVLTGSRREDAPMFEMMGESIKDDAYPWTRYNPLHGWPSEQVYAYVDAHQIPLPPHYKWKREAHYEAPDCMGCTWQPQHWAVMKQHYPKEFHRRWPRVAPVFQVLRQLNELQAAQLKELPDGG